MKKRFSRLTAVIFATMVSFSATASTLSPYPPQPAGLNWPTETWPEGSLGETVNRDVLDKELQYIWSQPENLRHTRALLIVHKGKLVYERYADDFSSEQRFISWSMAKSVTNILTGILVRQGKLDLDQRARVGAWRDASDPRSKITLRHLLNMTPGQTLVENGNQLETTTVKMLFGEHSDDMAAYAASLPFKHEPGTVWEYTTPGSTLIAALVGDQVTEAEDRIQRRQSIDIFIRSELTEIIGAKSFIGEYDSTGNFQGGSHAYMTARDWARFGYLLLRGGFWDGHRVVSEDWLNFSRTPAPVASNGTHGAHFWVKAEPAGTQWRTYTDDAPDDVFGAHGNEGQYVSVVPSRDLVIVRLGLTNNEHHDALGATMSRLLGAFPAE